MSLLQKPTISSKITAIYTATATSAVLVALSLYNFAPDSTISPISIISSTPSSSPSASKNILSFKVQDGDTLMSILNSANISAKDSHEALTLMGKVYDPEKLKIGQKIVITFDIDDSTNKASVDQEGLKLLALKIKTSTLDKEIEISRNEKGYFQLKQHIIPTKSYVMKAGGTIDSSLLGAATDLNIPLNITMELVKAFSYDIDFQRDIQPGDAFEVLFERIYNQEGEHIRDGNMLYASLTLGGRKMAIYRHTPLNGQSGYFNELGQSIRKDLLRTPLNIINITSKFGVRKHPVLGYSKMHKGVDFAAPIGTPIFAAGAGIIEEMGRKGAYGNYIRIRHNNNYSTAYAHISRFAKHLSRGDRINQGDVIAYVGSTGRSTGPHLHYEVMSRGQQIDPLKVKLASDQKLTGKELQYFEQSKRKVMAFINSIPKQQLIAFDKKNAESLVSAAIGPQKQATN